MFVEQLEPFRMYKGIYNFKGPVKRTHGIFILPLTSESKDLERFMRENMRFNNHINFRNIKGYFVPPIVRQKIKGRYIYQKIMPNDYAKILSKVRDLGVDFVFKDISRFNGRNIYYSMSRINSLIEAEKIPTKGVVEDYFELFIKPVMSTENYQDKYIIVPMYHTVPDRAKYLPYSFKDCRIEEWLMPYIRYNTLDTIKSTLGDNTVLLFVNDNGVLKVDLSRLSEKKIEDGGDLYTEIMKILMRMPRTGDTATFDAEDLSVIKDMDEEDEMLDEIDDEDPEVSKKVAAILQIDDGELTEEDIVKIEKSAKSEDVEEVNNVIKEITQRKIEVKEHKVATDNKNKKFIEKAMNVKVNDKTYKELIEDSKRYEIEATHYDINTVEEGFSNNKYVNFNTSYEEKLKPVDIANIAQSFSEMDVPLYVTDVQIKDASDSTNYVDEVTFTFHDENGKMGKTKIIVPKLIDGKFLFIGNSKKSIVAQRVPLPIVKLGDTVMLTTTHKKAFFYRKGGRYITPVESYVIRALDKIETVDIIKGDISHKNLELKDVPLSILAISRIVKEIKTKDLYINFNLQEAEMSEGNYLIGKYKGEDIWFDLDDDMVYVDDKGAKLELFNFIRTVSEDELPELYETINSIKSIPKLQYSTVKILSREVPVFLVLIYAIGLSELLERTNTNFEIIEKVEDMKRVKYDKDRQIIVEFQDSYLVITIDTTAVSLLFNYMKEIDFTNYKMSDMEDKNMVAILSQEFSGSHNFSIYLDNFINLMIDPITAEVLAYHDLPTEFPDVFIYASYLLSTGNNTEENDLSKSRIRSAEIITAAMYQAMADEYESYSVKRKRGGGRTSFSVKPNAVIQKLHELSSIEEYSTLNPVQEVAKTTSVSDKGLSGTNMDRAFDGEKRLYHPSYYGIISPVSSYGASIGVTKYLSINPNIESTRGHLKVTDIDDVDRLDGSSLISISEALTPFASDSDDSPRKYMNMTQFNHTMHTMGADPLLISNGGDELLAHMTSDFVKKAKDDGVIKDIKGNYVTIEYKNGDIDVIPFKVVERNSAKSMYVTNNLKLMSGLKVGSKLSKGQFVVYNDLYFQPNDGQLIFKPGPMVTMAVTTAPETYEDANAVSESLSQRLATKIVKRYSVLISKDTIVYNGVDKYMGMKAGDILLEYEDVPEDEDIAKFLEMNTSDLNKRQKKVKKSGHIVEIRVAYTCDKSALSKSIVKYINNVDNYLDTEENEKALANGSTLSKIMYKKKSTQVAADTKINGDKIPPDCVLFEYFIESTELFGKGDKCTNHTALKNVNSKVYPDDKMPVCLDSGRKIDLLLSPYCIESRMTTSLFKCGWLNCALIKLGEDMSKMPRAKAEKYILDFFSYIRPNDENINVYKDKFKRMNDLDFRRFQEGKMVRMYYKTFDGGLNLTAIKRGCDYVGVKTEEKITIPYLCDDPEFGPVISKNTMTILTVNVRRLQQMIVKQNNNVADISSRDKTNLAVGDSKGSMFSDNEVVAAAVKGLDKTITEFMTFRADHTISKDEAYSNIRYSGKTNIPDSINDPDGKTVMQYLNAMYLSMGISTDLIEDLKDQ